jgi:hypothetical protein
MSSQDSQYRFYQCQYITPELKCKQIEYLDNLLDINSTNSVRNTQLIAVPRYVPKILDKYILKYTFIPGNVDIKE